MNKNLIIKILALVSYVIMVVVNSLANVLNFNNYTTGDISNLYPNLFAPAPITFSIWGLIYLLLFVYSIYQFKKSDNEKLYRKINIYFILSSVANILWIFSWHNNIIPVSALLILVILFSLIKIADLLNKEKLSKRNNILIALPFTIYFGWITIATVANITTFLVSLGWGRLGLPDYIWMIIILLIATSIGILRLFKDKRYAYGLVFIWAYTGILIKHISSSGFSGRYIQVIITTSICILVFLISETIIYIKGKKNEVISKNPEIKNVL
ncbi:tryptophan-rich sensory protein [Patescibacteria group bacterium]|nr:tryptophan-rich sensory protein [Patescibacteria group bacterium]